MELNKMDIEFKISNDKGKMFCETHSNTIYFGDNENGYNRLSQKDFLIYMADSITHEVIHAILYKEFNITVSKLFDTIEAYFYTDRKTMESLYNNMNGLKTWETYIKEHGLRAFFNYYDITNTDIFEANCICNGLIL